MTDNKERTFIMIKPDGVQRGLVGKIIQRFEDKGFKLVAMKMVWVSGNRRHRLFRLTRVSGLNFKKDLRTKLGYFWGD